MIGNGRTSRTNESGGFVFGLGSGAENIGPEFMAAHRLMTRCFDGDAVMGRNRPAAIGPLPHHLAFDLDGASKSRLAAGSCDSFLDVSCVHGATIALLSLTSNSFANRREWQF